MILTGDNKLKRIRLLRSTLRLIWESAPGWSVANFILLILQGIFPLAVLYLTKIVIDSIVASQKLPVPEFYHVLMYVLGLAVVILLRVLCSSLTTLVNEAQGQSVTDHVHSLIHKKSVKMDLAYYENPKYYDTLHRAQYEAAFRPMRIVLSLVQVSRSAITLIALVGLLFSLHWIIAIVLLLAEVPGTIVRLKYSKKLYLMLRDGTSSERHAGYYQWLLVSEPSAKEIRLFDIGSLFISRFSEVRKLLRQERLGLAAHRSAAELAVQVLSNFAVFGLLTYIAYLTVYSVITIGAFVMYHEALQRGQGYLQEFLGGIANLYEDSLFIDNLFEFLDMQPSIVEPSAPSVFPLQMQKGITFDHVSFKYADSESFILKDISLTIRPSEHVALVGANGAGKTTFIKLLCRLYDPTGGRILIDGIDIREFDTGELHSQLSVLFQDYAHYHLSALENIWLGNIRLSQDDDKIKEAAGKAGADAVINRLPDSYNTRLGMWFEDGHELSIGEWQKIALSRAFVRDSQIIVLDEPTSALDASAEYEIFQKFSDLTDGKTTVLVSHRLSSVRMMDKIYVIDDGRITASGSHEELMLNKGIYARLFEMQAEKYR